MSTSPLPVGPFAPPADLATHPAVVAATDVADRVLAPRTGAADDPARGVTREACEAVAAAGLLSVTVPADEGGHGAGARVDAETVELLAGACGATWFVGTQAPHPAAAGPRQAGGPAGGERPHRPRRRTAPRRAEHQDAPRRDRDRPPAPTWRARGDRRAGRLRVAAPRPVRLVHRLGPASGPSVGATSGPRPQRRGELDGLRPVPFVAEPVQLGQHPAQQPDRGRGRVRRPGRVELAPGGAVDVGEDRVAADSEIVELDGDRAGPAHHRQRQGHPGPQPGRLPPGRG
ncbi:acyl-CoA dehydrogenase family protein [Pseudonocardia ammonioxydans]|uniref:acyl-CoA dehydrogenase family protein n=1 Tax=Pseudonocardia ammonioxydans TaxID=260086 RepID=UPI000B81EB08|nr:acyl-CoA dehydrogenase family protein [Pseudonocardia ammonioxydans]